MTHVRTGRKIRALERRLARLDYLIENWSPRAKPEGVSYAREERSALAWALEIVRERLEHQAAAKTAGALDLDEGQERFDADELLRWAETYGHPEDWAKRAQAAHARAERLAEQLAALEHSMSEQLAALEDSMSSALERSGAA